MRSPPSIYKIADIVAHRQRIPCLTTPAPTSEGRPAPKRMRGQIDTMVKQRWLTDIRKYAPWAYEEHAMQQDKDGHFHKGTVARIQGQLHPSTWGDR